MHSPCNLSCKIRCILLAFYLAWFNVSLQGILQSLQEVLQLANLSDILQSLTCKYLARLTARFAIKRPNPLHDLQDQLKIMQALRGLLFAMSCTNLQHCFIASRVYWQCADSAVNGLVVWSPIIPPPQVKPHSYTHTLVQYISLSVIAHLHLLLFPSFPLTPFSLLLLSFLLALAASLTASLS